MWDLFVHISYRISFWCIVHIKLGTCKDIVFAGLISCPWYLSTQTDRGLQAKYNNIFVIYKYKTEQLFTPVTPHENEKNQVIEEVSIVELLQSTREE